jgi:hypothetical protein
MKQGHMYGVIESGLYGKGLPTRTLALEVEKCASRLNFCNGCSTVTF